MTDTRYNKKSGPGKAIERLHDRGGHFVLCRGKRPIWQGWRNRRPDLASTIMHGPEIGLIPYSIGTSALDVDQWTAEGIGELVEATDPLVTLPSPRGHHCYFGDDTPRGNRKFDGLFGCGGEVRSAKGYLRLYEGGAERLVSALVHTDLADCLFPADLFAAAGVTLPRSIPVEPATVHLVNPPANLKPLEEAREGARHVTFFDHLRFWSYRQDKGKDLAVWADQCAGVAAAMHRRIPVVAGQRAYSLDEALRTAWAVASWTWNGGGPIDHTPRAQRRRGVKSGKVRRGVAVGRTVDMRWKADRDAAIVEAVMAGAAMRAVARQHGIAEGTVRHVMRRDVALWGAVRNEPNKGV